MRKLIFIYIILIAAIYFKIIDVDKLLSTEENDLEYIREKAQTIKDSSTSEAYKNYCGNPYLPFNSKAFFEYKVYYDYDENKKENLKITVPKDTSNLISLETSENNYNYELGCQNNGITIDNLYFLEGNKHYSEIFFKPKIAE